MTGGAGFIGTNLAHHFAERGNRVTVFDDLSRAGTEENLRWLVRRHGDRIRVVLADVREPGAVGNAVDGVDVVFHLAAQVAVTTSVKDPMADFAVNARGTLAVLEAARAQKRPPIVLFSSTNKVYGGLEDVELTEGETRYRPSAPRWRGGVPESMSLDFRSPYGCSKGAADQYVLDYGRVYGLPTVVFRMSCIYGPHQHGNADQGWIAHFLLGMLQGRPLTIFGDGKQVRDILWVDDLVDAFSRAVDRIDEVAGEAFNVGGGRERTLSLLELVDLMGRLAGRPIDVEHGPWRPGDQRWFVTDHSRLSARTGWSPRAGVSEGVERLYRRFARRRASASAIVVAAAAAR